MNKFAKCALKHEPNCFVMVSDGFVVPQLKNDNRKMLNVNYYTCR